MKSNTTMNMAQGLGSCTAPCPSPPHQGQKWAVVPGWQGRAGEALAIPMLSWQHHSPPGGCLRGPSCSPPIQIPSKSWHLEVNHLKFGAAAHRERKFTFPPKLDLLLHLFILLQALQIIWPVLSFTLWWQQKYYQQESCLVSTFFKPLGNCYPLPAQIRPNCFLYDTILESVTLNLSDYGKFHLQYSSARMEINNTCKIKELASSCFILWNAVGPSFATFLIQLVLKIIKCRH